MKQMLVLWLTLLLSGAAGAEPITPLEHRRGEDQTYLTFPEWYLVHSPAEFAQHQAAGRNPGEFAWGGHIGQFWQGYRAVTHETRDYPFNGGYHLMVSVIGASTTVEYGLRAAYESTVGRLAWASRRGAATAEELLGARVAQAYVDFIRVEPWYLFDFIAPLEQLWFDTPMDGADLLRKWERRFVLTTEYVVKAGYAWLIKLGTQSVYEAAKPVTAVVLNQPPPEPLPAGLTEWRLLDANPPGAAQGAVLGTVPRYRAFMSYAQALAAQGLEFQEVAGNSGVIVISVIDRSDAPPAAPPLRTVFVQPILTQQGSERRVMAVPIAQLATQLRRWQAAGVQVEHVYDY
jgi:hypothetical protein